MDEINKKSSRDIEAEDIIKCNANIKPTKKRYFILFLYVVLTALKSFQWISLASITNVVSSFYRVDNMAINWTTVVFMITFLILALPVNFIMEKIGLRRSLLIGSFGLSVGLIIKCFSIAPDRFWLMMVAQLVIGCVEPFFYSTYSQVAFAWFPDNQVAMATATGVIGESLGIALGFFIPGLLVGHDIYDDDRITWGLETLSISMTILCSLNTFLIILFFDENPKHPPGIARSKQLELKDEQKTDDSTKSLKNFIKLLYEFYSDRNFNLLQIGFGCNMGTEYALHTVLNQVVTSNGDKELGFESPITVTANVGMILLVAGMFGSIMSGFLLDKFHDYKRTHNIAYLLSLLLMMAFTFCLRQTSPIALYLITVPLGLFLTSQTCCGYEFAVEITYPRSELVAATLLNVTAEVFGIAVTFIVSYITDIYGSSSGCFVVCAFLAFGLFTSCLVEPNYGRQKIIRKYSTITGL